MVNYTFIYSINNWLLRDIERIKILKILCGHMVILGRQNKNTDFLVILAIVSL